MEDILSTGGYVVARENFKEAAEHVSPEKDPVMFNLLFGLQSLADQIAADFIHLESAVRDLSAPSKKKSWSEGMRAPKQAARKKPSTTKRGRARKR